MQVGSYSRASASSSSASLRFNEKSVPAQALWHGGAAQRKRQGARGAWELSPPSSNGNFTGTLDWIGTASWCSQSAAFKGAVAALQLARP